MQQFEREADQTEQRQQTVQPNRARPETDAELEARIAAYREMGLTEQEAVADLKRQTQSEIAVVQWPMRRKTTGLRAFAETSAAIGAIAVMMRLAGPLVFALARSATGQFWPIALLCGAACCAGIGYAVEALTPRRAAPAILTILAIYLTAFASEAAFDGYLSSTVLTILCAYTMGAAGLGLTGARLRRKQRERRLAR